MMYSDDFQLYIFLRRNNRTTAMEKLQACIEDDVNWFICNVLLGNPSKTERIHFYSCHMQPECPLFLIKVDGNDHALCK